mmetsp:Transcript_162096/g.298951  ORF Transcript_162096/g.298951 Transcript_162096/m.298951 type:complete len:119 (+) Transcript_162096:157-513(+)
MRYIDGVHRSMRFPLREKGIDRTRPKRRQPQVRRCQFSSILGPGAFLELCILQFRASNSWYRLQNHPSLLLYMLFCAFGATAAEIMQLALQVGSSAGRLILLLFSGPFCEDHDLQSRM